ncbi:MAG: division/cell wall cluster transcriptional repressor MraZ [Ferruginibacter sp.]
MIGFLGEYEVTMDAKGRFLLPSGFKKQLGEEGANLFVINRGIEACLSLYPMQSWEPIFSEVSKLNEFDPKVRQFRRYFLNGATQVELDAAGRLLVPRTLIEYAGLEKDVVLVSAVNKIEIWDKAKYTRFFESFTPESYSELANEVMNKNGERLSS